MTILQWCALSVIAVMFVASMSIARKSVLASASPEQRSASWRLVAALCGATMLSTVLVFTRLGS